VIKALSAGDVLTSNRKSPRRTASKQQRRIQLIQATLGSIAERGIANTSIANVAQEAGLSQGIVNLHFESKDRLFVESLRHLADEYRQNWEQTLEGAGPDPVSRLSALVEMDFSVKVCQRKKLAVWFAFWGEARSRPTYAKICAQRDTEYERALSSVCAGLIEKGKYNHLDPGTISLTLGSMIEGLWLDMLIVPNKVSRKRALAAVKSYLANIFPRHFDPAGE
jgi:TetR/AcrR family transcriptional repressor of bet genes